MPHQKNTMNKIQKYLMMIGITIVKKRISLMILLIRMILVYLKIDKRAIFRKRPTILKILMNFTKKKGF